MKITDYRALADFRYQIRRFLNGSEQAARAAGVNPQHQQILLALKGAPPGQETTITYLAERLQLRHHSLVELVDRLEAHRLARRSRSRRDRRVVLVAVTPRGERILRKLSLYNQQLLRGLRPVLLHDLERLPSSTRQLSLRAERKAIAAPAHRRSPRRRRPPSHAHGSAPHVAKS